MHKKGLLSVLVTGLLVPTILAFGLAWVVYMQFEKSMEALADNYVENLVDSVAARLDSRKWNIDTPDSTMRITAARDVDAIAELFSEMKLPGMFAVFTKDGKLLYGTPGKVNFLKNWIDSFDSATPKRIRTEGGSYYTGMFYSIPDEGIYIIGAVSWKNLFGSMVLLVIVWPCIMGLLAVMTMFALYLLNKKVIIPLKQLDGEVSRLQLGRDVPAESSDETSAELRHLRSTFRVLAQSAVDKELLSRDYITDIVKAQEEEREHISREIHDGPLQYVTALVQRLRLLALEVGDDKNILEKLDNAEEVAMIGVKELREFCNNLTPPWLDLGLRHSLAELCNRMEKQLNVKIDLQTFDDQEGEEEILPLPLCLAFYRVAQESINNSVSHGEATEIVVKLEREHSRVYMCIEDNGTGFNAPDDVKELRVKGHRGLSNMKERIRLAGGLLNIKSTVGKGTIISCEVPIQRVE